jgi:hypothetical protein
MKFIYSFFSSAGFAGVASGADLPPSQCALCAAAGLAIFLFFGNLAVNLFKEEEGV